MKRIQSIDIVRGLVMIIMALDHARDLIHTSSVTQSPTDLSTTTPILFFTRWITYLCAPTFVFLSGTSAYLSLKRKDNYSESRIFLLKRGCWLIILEFSIVNFGLFFDPDFHTLLFEVIAAIGFGFIILSLLLKIPARITGIIGLLIIFCHELLNVTPLFVPGTFPFLSNRVFVMGYPPIPWLGVMLIGYASGKLFELPAKERQKIFLRTGCIALLLFVMIRLANVYGDALVWSYQKNTFFTFLSFINLSKYPPSLLFCLVTLGIMFLILTFAEKAKNPLMDIAIVYGKVPLFYFVLHFYIIHIIMICTMFLQGFHWPDLDFASGNFGRPKGVSSGLSLGPIYIIWIAVVALLYKPCRWFGRYKSEHAQWWLKYI
jgi:uncharacterized membrane protein